MRGFFDEQLELLNTQLIEMGTLIEHSIRSAAEALVSQDIAQAKESMRFDKKVDEKEREIEALCLKLLLRQQPVARDLRFISSALKMITDMERIGDQVGGYFGDRPFYRGSAIYQKAGAYPRRWPALPSKW